MIMTFLEELEERIKDREEKQLDDYYHKLKKTSLLKNIQRKEEILTIRRNSNSLDFLYGMKSWYVLLKVIDEQINEERIKKIKKLKKKLHIKK